MPRTLLSAFAVLALAALAACAAGAPLSPEAQRDRRAQEVRDSDNEAAVRRMQDEFDRLADDGSRK